MRNIFLFIRRYFTLISFVLLQIFAWAMLIKYSRTHEAIFANNANEVTGYVSGKYKTVEDYLYLKKANEDLAAENARLKNMMAISFQGPDSTQQFYIDSLSRDTLGRVRKFLWLPAKVVNNDVNNEANYITLHRGRNQGVEKDMIVVGPNGIIGKVVLVSDNYARVMSLLNRFSKVSAMLKKDNYSGMVEWDGKDPRYVTLNNISKSAKVAKGDTVITSNLSEYPAGLMIGTVANITAEKASNYYTLTVKTSTNFFTLQYAYVVANLLYGEQKQLEAQTPKAQ